MKAAELTIEVVCQNLPGSCFNDTHGENPKKVGPIYLGIQKGNDVIEIVPGDRQQATFHPTFRVTRQAEGSPNFLGAFAKGTAQERFFYLSWGVVGEDGLFEMFRRAKIHLNHLTWDQVEKAMKQNRAIRVEIGMTAKNGEPICASVRSDRAKWDV